MLGDRLLRIGVKIAAHGGGEIGQLIGGQTLAAAKHHVLGGVRGAGKRGGGFIRTDEIINHGGGDGREGVPNDDYTQAIREGRPGDVGIIGRQGAGGGGSDKQPQQHDF